MNINASEIPMFENRINADFKFEEEEKKDIRTISENLAYKSQSN